MAFENCLLEDNQFEGTDQGLDNNVIRDLDQVFLPLQQAFCWPPPFSFSPPGARGSSSFSQVPFKNVAIRSKSK